MTPISEDEIEAGRTERGGFNAQTIAGWGVPWPPPSGWRTTILAHGIPYDPTKNEFDEIAGHEPHELLRKVVLAVVNAGHASDFYEFPDVLDYFGAQLPPEVTP